MVLFLSAWNVGDFGRANDWFYIVSHLCCVEDETRRGLGCSSVILCLTGFLMPTMPTNYAFDPLNALSRCIWVFGCSTFCQMARSFVFVFLYLFHHFAHRFRICCSLFYFQRTRCNLFQLDTRIYLCLFVMFNLNWCVCSRRSNIFLAYTLAQDVLPQ